MASDDIMALTKARALLTILMATCEQTLIALDAAGNAVDSDLTEDLRRMIERSQKELAVMEDKLGPLRA